METLLLLVAAGGAFQPTPDQWPRLDFTRANDAGGWTAAHDVGALTPTNRGLAIEVTGGDPYIIGPMLKLPRKASLKLTIHLQSDVGGVGRVYYAGPGQDASEERVVRFDVRPGIVDVIRVRLPELGPDLRLRFDPPGTHGRCLLVSLRLDPRPVIREPAWPKTPPRFTNRSPTIRSGSLVLTHSSTAYGDWALHVDREIMAVGYSRPLVGYVIGAEVRWFPVPGRALVKASGDAIEATATGTDPDGGHWRFVQRFAKAPHGTIEVDTSITVDKDRQVVFVPAFIALPGVLGFGQSKGQALFPGLEYLDKDEPSSSEADVVGAGALRRVPDRVKVTIPLMVVQAEGRYVALAWQPSPNVAALFDSPDRVFGSRGHVIGLVAPGSNGSNRVDGAVLAEDPGLVGPASPLHVRARIFGGAGRSVVPAVKAWVREFGVPSVEKPAAAALIESAAAGWLHSGVRDGARYRHAYWPGVSSFRPGPSAEAALLMQWLSTWPDAAKEAADLRGAAREAIALVDPRAYATSTITHEPTPAAPLVFGHVEEAAALARNSAGPLLARFEPDGSLLYRKQPNGPDYGKTHFAKDANGLTAWSVHQLLVDASLCGHKQILGEAVEKLDALSKFRDGVPRGAQTWEVPLHTPDILASALMVKCYVLGYLLTGKKRYLDEAQYWAWTGVPFVYLTPPAAGPVGLYATIAVFGATNWTAPTWMGMPVQWCGIVYADALYSLAEQDTKGPWKRIADGIVVSAIEQSFPRGDATLHGLLPDSFNLRPQTRNGVAINPGTLQIVAGRLYGELPVCEMHAFVKSGVYVHVPGAIRDVEEKGETLGFTAVGWPREPYYILLAGLHGSKSIKVDGLEVRGTPSCVETDIGCTILRVEGKCRVIVETGR